jgi:hypothetical protein
MEATIERTDICYYELINMIEGVGFNAALHFLYYRVKNAHGRGQLVPIEHESEVGKIISLHNNEKKIHLYVFREKPSIDIATPGSQNDDESGSTRNKRAYTVSGYPFIPNLQRTTPSTQTLIHIFPVTFLCML